MLQKSLIVVFAIIAIGGSAKFPFLPFSRWAIVRIDVPVTTTTVAPVKTTETAPVKTNGTASVKTTETAPVKTTGIAPLDLPPAIDSNFTLPSLLWIGAGLECKGHITIEDCNICSAADIPLCTNIDCSTVPEWVKVSNKNMTNLLLPNPAFSLETGKMFRIPCGLCVALSKKKLHCRADYVQDLDW